jgi:hypothetical protein
MGGKFHFAKSTVQAEIFCNRCMKMTPWRVADGRRQYCLTCYDRRKENDVKAVVKPEQPKLF